MRRREFLLLVLLMCLLMGIWTKGILAEGPAKDLSTNLGEIINSAYDDFSPVISADGNYLYFASNRPGSLGGDDFWVSVRVGGEWRPPRNLGEPINTSQNEGPDTFSPDQRVLYFTGCNLEPYYPDHKGMCDIYVTYNKGGKWAQPANLGEPINTENEEANASLSADQSTLFFASDRPGGYGSYDIWMSRRTSTGWSEPENLGPNINTPKWEGVAFMHAGGENLYFSSNGHGGFGNADVFMSKISGGSWSKAKNMGPTVNTPRNDIYFTVPGSGDLAYYSSNRQGGFGNNDIYVVPLPMELRPKTIIIVKGKVTDKDTKKPIKAIILLEYIDTGKEVALTSSDPKTGRFEIILPVGANYILSATAKNYIFHTERFDVPETQGYKVIVKHIALTPIKKNAKVVLNNIYFDFDKATLRPESNIELEKVVKLMNDHPFISVELGGHTDSVGSSKYNRRLSGRRANSVKKYILGRGINKRRVVAKGYGESRPRVTNKTPEGRQLNRRTEFKILSVTYGQ